MKVGFVFSISNFFINKNSPGRKLSAEKIPSCGNSALVESHFLTFLDKKNSGQIFEFGFIALDFSEGHKNIYASPVV